MVSAWLEDIVVLHQLHVYFELNELSCCAILDFLCWLFVRFIWQPVLSVKYVLSLTMHLNVNGKVEKDLCMSI